MTDQPDTYCCQRMKMDLTRVCEQHTRADCPDVFFDYHDKFDEYGLLHRDGMSVITIEFCPFCGTKFPESARDRWFDELDAKGIDSSLGSEEIPEEYRTGAWRLGA